MCYLDGGPISCGGLSGNSREGWDGNACRLLNPAQFFADYAGNQLMTAATISAGRTDNSNLGNGQGSGPDCFADSMIRDPFTLADNHGANVVFMKVYVNINLNN